MLSARLGDLDVEGASARPGPSVGMRLTGRVEHQGGRTVAVRPAPAGFLARALDHEVEKRVGMSVRRDIEARRVSRFAERQAIDLEAASRLPEERPGWKSCDHRYPDVEWRTRHGQNLVQPKRDYRRPDAVSQAKADPGASDRTRRRTPRGGETRRAASLELENRRSSSLKDFRPDSDRGGCAKDVSRGDYQLTDNSFRLCFAFPAAERPDDFVTYSGSGRTLFVYRRAPS